MFGRDYEEIGDSKKGLILKNSGKIKIQWGNTFLDLLDKEGKLNIKEPIQDIDFITIVSNISDIKKAGTYYDKTLNQFIIYFDKDKYITLPLTSIKISESAVKPVNIYENKNVITKIVAENDFYYSISFRSPDYIYQQGDIILFYIDYQEKTIPIYFTVLEYDILTNSIKGFVPTQYEDRTFDYTLLENISNIECYLYQYSKKENIQSGESENDIKNNTLVVGQLDSKKYRTNTNYGIISKQNILYSTRFDYDKFDTDKQFPEYSKDLYNQIVINNENSGEDTYPEGISDNTILPIGIIKELLNNNNN